MKVQCLMHSYIGDVVYNLSLEPLTSSQSAKVRETSQEFGSI